MQPYETGARRNTSLSARYDLIPPSALRRLAETYAEGAHKHGERNWEKGMPMSDLLNHAIEHLLAWSAGDRGEDHLAHAAWNILAIMHFEGAVAPRRADGRDDAAPLGGFPDNCCKHLQTL